MNIILTNLVVAVSALVIELSILKFYNLKRPIPTINNKLFTKIINMAVTITSLNAINFFVTWFGVSKIICDIHYFLIVIYYVLYEVFAVYIAKYILWNSIKRKKLVRSRFMKLLPGITAISALIMLFVDRKIFFIDESNIFRFDEHFYIANIFPIIIVLLSLFIFVKDKHGRMEARDRGIINGFIILILGMLSDNVISDVVIIDFFFCFFTMILYISVENSGSLMSEGKNCYNYHAFELLVDECISENKDFYVYGLELRNYESIKTIRGTRTLYEALSRCADAILNHFEDAYVFYTDNECFNVFSFKKIPEKEFVEFVKYSKEMTYGEFHRGVHFWTRFIKIDTQSEFCKSAAYIVNGEIYVAENDVYNSIVLYVDDSVYKRLQYEIELHDIMEKSIANNNFDIYIQPIYNVVSEKIDGGEVLLRLKDENYGMIMPGDFIPLAEKSGLIMKLSYMTFDKVCSYVSKNNLREIGINFININCSPVEFQDLYLVEKLKDISDSYNVDFSIFKFEVTEAYMSNCGIMGIHIAKLKRYGASIAMDDFGKESSNLSRLSSYDFDVAKIDLSLVWDYFDKKNTIMKDVINIFKSEELTIVAEGVETEVMVRGLVEMGCSYLQGYYFAKPMPIEDFVSYVKNFNGI